MIGVVILLAGMAIGATVALAIEATWRAIVRLRPPFYPAHRDRWDTRPSREVGVRVFDRREYDLPRLGEPPTFLPDVEAFDKEPTHGD